jgi:hypothetical protein
LMVGVVTPAESSAPADTSTAFAIAGKLRLAAKIINAKDLFEKVFKVGFIVIILKYS